MQLSKPGTPLAADFKLPANIWSKLVKSATPLNHIQPRARNTDRSVSREIRRLCRLWCGLQAIKVGQGIRTGNRTRNTVIQFEKKRGMANRQAAWRYTHHT